MNIKYLNSEKDKEKFKLGSVLEEIEKHTKKEKENRIGTEEKKLRIRIGRKS